MKSIKTRLILTFTAIILLLAGSIGAVATTLARNTLMQNARSELVRLAEEEAKYVLTRAQVQLRYMEALARNSLLTDKSSGFDEKVRFCEEEAQRMGYLAFAFADKNGESTVFNTQRETTNVAERDYFKTAMAGTSNVSDVLISSVTGSAVLIFATPVYQNGQVAGVLYGRRDGNALSEIVSEVSFRKTGFAYMVNTKGTAVGNQDRELVASQANYIEMAKTDPGFKELAQLMEQKMLSGAVDSAEYEYQGKDQIVAFAPVEGTPWIMVVGVDAAEITGEADGLRNAILLVCLIAMLVGLLVVYLVSARIAQPIRAVTAVAKQIADGNFDVQRFAITKDEVGQLSQAFNLTIDRLVNYQGYIDEISDALLQVSQGNLGVELKREYIGQFRRLKDNMTALLDGLNATVGQISQAADQVSGGSEQMAYGSQALSQGASEQASAVEQLSAAISEITAQIRQSAESARQVNAKAGEAGRELADSEHRMVEMTSAMEEIAAKSSEISKIIKTIDDIAFQTNILALNAAVEAARAGAAGKGFAVVADEVRALASKSATAAKDITQLIDGTLTAVRQGSDIAGQTAAALVGTVGTTNEVVALIGEISRTAADQALSIDQVNQGVEQISTVVQTNAATAEESAATSQELSSQSALLKGLLERFRLRGAPAPGAAAGYEAPEEYPVPYAGALPAGGSKY